MIYSKSPRQYYPANQVFDLKEEFEGLLYGYEDNPGIGQQVLVRRLQDQKCICFDTLRGSPNPNCKYCQGEGYRWIETLNTCYLARDFGSVQDPSNVISRESFIAQFGVSDENRALAFFEAKAFPNYERYLIPTIPLFDKLYELKVNESGRLVKPVVRTKKWQVRSITPHRGDNGAVTYVTAGLSSEFV